MAKKQSFGEKAAKKKGDVGFRSVKVVFSARSEKTGHWKYSEKFVKIPNGEDDIKLLEAEYQKI